MKRIGRLLGMRASALGFASVLQALWLGLLASEIGPADLGVFGLIASAGAILGALGGFGFGAAALRLKGEVGDLSTLSAMLLLRAIVAVLLAVALGIGFFAVDEVAALVVSVALASVLVEYLSELVQGALSGQVRHSVAVASLVIQKALPLAGALVSLPFGSVLPGILCGLVLALPVSITAVVPILVKPASLIRTIRLTRSFWSASIVSNLTQFDIPLTRLVSGIEASGYYTVANRMVSPLGIITSAMLNIFVPELTRADDCAARIRLFRLMRKIATIAAAILAVAAVPISEFAVWFLGEDYRPARIVIVAFVVAVGLSGVSRTYQALLFAENSARTVAIALLVGALCGFGGIVLFSSLFGVGGIAAGPIAAQVAILILVAVAVARRHRQGRP